LIIYIEQIKLSIKHKNSYFIDLDNKMYIYLCPV